MARIPQIQELVQSEYTKKDLEALFDISDNTVITTLKACGLSTSVRQYTIEEIRERFFPARQMFDAGKSSTEIADFFSMKSAEMQEEHGDVSGAEKEAEFADLIEDQMVAAVYDYAYERAGQVVPIVRSILLDALKDRILDEDRNIRGQRVREIARRWRAKTYLNGSSEEIEGVEPPEESG
ncbi:hypothetical protein [Leptolyngbya sp. GGD]|uniref:hypothetical protein n=1 Tax=Leptolyngbya sp. GGD TaxID=2997907 RepID=UPI00227BF6A8|nr:hypothetical protein [Leptolyngbya sp. GGD]MCY6494541.1 hypothetical protein [Leptolyngbya sp. GGD]